MECVELQDFRQLERLLLLFRDSGVSLRMVELINALRVPRTAGYIEARLRMDRMTLKAFARKRPDLIMRTVVHEVPRQRGKPPVLYGLTPQGIRLVDAMAEIFKRDG